MGSFSFFFSLAAQAHIHSKNCRWISNSKKLSLWSSFTSVIARLLMYLDIVQAKQAQQTSDSPEESEWMQPNSDTCHFVFCISTPSPRMFPFNEWGNTVPHTKPSALALLGLLALLLVSMNLETWQRFGCQMGNCQDLKLFENVIQSKNCNE